MKIKRTYNLSEDTVEAVRSAIECDHLAASQDALVELAISDFFLSLRHAQEERIFASAASEMQGENRELESKFASSDRETWPQ